MNISGLYNQLQDLPNDHSYRAVQIPEYEGIFLGVDRSKRPCLFIAAQSRLLEPNLRAAHVSLRPNQAFDLTLPDTSKKRGLFHALLCETDDRSDKETFVSLIDAFLAQTNNARLASQTIGEFFRSLVRLFAEGTVQDKDAERQGLWGELFLMRQIRGYQHWAPFWHSEVTRLYDFSAPGKRLEVKTGSGGQRVHHFSHRQVFSMGGEQIVIASLLVREEDSGLSLHDLIVECRNSLLFSPYYLKLERSVRHAGMEDPEESGPIYDPNEALHSLAWFKSTEVPHFNQPEPVGVSQTSYRIDLTNAPQINSGELGGWLDSWRIDYLDRA